MAYFKMTRLALKWALSKPVTTRYPFEPRVPLPGSRGTLDFSRENCVYCNICAKKCPTGAITVQRNSKRWSIDRLLCISCGYCVESCPKACLDLNTGHPAPSITKDREMFNGQPAPAAST